MWGLLEKADTIHRDLKPENILLNHEGRAFLADVGAAKVFSSNSSALDLKKISLYVGTPKWMSPEMRKLNLDDSQPVIFQLPKSDIFSLGLIALYCLDYVEFSRHKNLNKNERELEEYLDNFWERCENKGFYYLLRTMLSFSPSTRPSIYQLFKDFSELNTKSLISKQSNLSVIEKLSQEVTNNFFFILIIF